MMKKKIAFISQPEYFRFMYEHDLDNIFHVREFPFHFSMSSADFSDLEEYDADYNIFFRGEFFPEDVLRRLNGIRIALSSEPFPRKINGKWEYSLDSLVRYSVFRRIRNKAFDYVFHYDAASIPLFEMDGLRLSGEFAFPVACGKYFPNQQKLEKKWDLFFIGRSTDHREYFFGPLKHHFNFLHIAHGIWGEELIDYIGKSKICINVHAEDERSWEPRLQMILAAGAFVISEPITPNKYIKPGRDFIESATPDDFYEKISYYLKNESEREKIAKQGMETVRSKLSASSSVLHLVKKISSKKYPKFLSGKADSIVSILTFVSAYLKKISDFHFRFFFKKWNKKILNLKKEYQRNGFSGVFFRVFLLFIGLVSRFKIFKRFKKVVGTVVFCLKEYKRTGWVGAIKRIAWILFNGIDYFPVPHNEQEWKDMKQRLDSLKKERESIIINLNNNQSSSRKKKVIYVIPGTAISGGVAIVLNHLNRLQEKGYETLLVSLNHPTPINWFPNQTRVISVHELDWHHIFNADVVVATHWSTAFFVDLLPVKRKMYFVQSDERRFNPESQSEVRAIEATYRLDMGFFTEAAWIQRWLKEEFGHDAYYVPNGLDEKVFFPRKKIGRKSRKIRVLLEGPIDFWFKGMREAYEAVRNLDCELWVVSSHGKPPKDWHIDYFFENVPMNKMGDIYSSCDIFLKMSYMEGFFGPPMEAMACGCSVVVGEVTGYDEYIIHERNALVVDQGDIDGARKAVERLMNNDLLREELIENGYKTAKEWNWSRSINLLEKVISGAKPEKYYTDVNPKKYDYNEEVNRLAYIKKRLK